MWFIFLLRKKNKNFFSLIIQITVGIPTVLKKGQKWREEVGEGGGSKGTHTKSLAGRRSEYKHILIIRSRLPMTDITKLSSRQFSPAGGQGGSQGNGKHEGNLTNCCRFEDGGAV